MQPDIISESAGTGVYRTHLTLLVIELILILLRIGYGDSNAVFLEILAQLAEGNVVIHKACFLELILLGDTGRKHSYGVISPQVLLDIGSTAGDRAVYGRKVSQQLGLIGLNILYYGSAGLGDNVADLLLLDSPQVSPGADISAERYVIDKAALLAEPVKYSLPLSGVNRLYSGGSHDYQLFLFQSAHAFICIIYVVSRAVITGIDALAAGDTSVGVFGGVEPAALDHFGYIGLGCGT